MKQFHNIRIHIIEPHPDDAFGSASALCFFGAGGVCVHTVTDSQDDRSGTDLTRQPDTRKYITQHQEYGLKDYHWELRIKEAVPYAEMMESYRKNYGAETLSRLCAVLTEIVETAAREHAILASPLGILHPMHMLASGIVLDIASQRLNPEQLWIYVDHPYDLHSMDTDIMQQSIRYAQNRLGWKLLRYDVGGNCQLKAGKIVRAVYHDLHHAEFDGAFEKTMCSFYLPAVSENSSAQIFAPAVLENSSMQTAAHDLVKFARHLQLSRSDILMITSQAYPFLGGGGLANVIYGMGKTAQNFTGQLRILLFCDGSECNFGIRIRETEFKYDAPDGSVRKCSLTTRNYQGLCYYLLSVPELFEGVQEDPQPHIYVELADIVLSRVLELLDFEPCILHCHDWQSAGIPLLIKTKYNKNPACKNIKVVYTIHFYGYQGVCRLREIKPFLDSVPGSRQRQILKKLQYLSLGAQKMAGVSDPELGSLMNAGIRFADCVSTVSPGYARELQTYPALGKNVKVTGIRNGIYIDGKTVSRLDAHTFSEEKRKSKRRLQEALGLEMDAEAMLICMTARLEPVKGVDDVLVILQHLMRLPVQIVIMGDELPFREGYYSGRLRRLAGMFSLKFCYLPFDRKTEMDLYMGADVLLMPSHVESCGTVQMLAMHFGVIPAVSCIAALEDSVALPSKERMEKGVGYFFYHSDCWMMYETILKILDDFRDKEKWDRMVWKNIVTDFSWVNGPVKKYMELYHRLLSQ